MSEHNLLGEKGEELARGYLLKKGYRILACNWRFKKAELDIIAKEKDCLVIVEVKSRSSTAFERPQDAVTMSKQKRIVKAADAYILEKDIHLECRFDVISVLFEGNKFKIEHMEDAFQPHL